MSVNRKWLKTGLFWLLILLTILAIYFIIRPQSSPRTVSIQMPLADITEQIQGVLPVAGWLILGLLLVGCIIFLLFRALVKPDSPSGKERSHIFTGRDLPATFADIAGADEAQQELQEIIEFLKYPDKFTALGARLPRGLLLIGPAGTGKTLMARAIAGEAGVTFLKINGPELAERALVGGTSLVRKLFEEARRNSPCIIFVDDIDTVGHPHSSVLGNIQDERKQTLNQIVIEMDSISAHTQIIVIAATNRPDRLEPALLRAGRFERQVILDLPDIRGRIAILELHARKKSLGQDISLEVIARKTPGFSGGDLVNLLNEAAILTARRNKPKIGMSELEEAIDRVMSSPARKSRIISEREKSITAYHEVGHALVARMLPNTDPVHKVSIVARGLTGGFTMLLPTEDRYLWSKAQFDDILAYALGGHAAELIAFGEVTTGASNDIERATCIAHSMVTEYGMSKRIGPVALNNKAELIFPGHDLHEPRGYSEETAREIDEEVRAIIQAAFDKAHTILTQNKKRLILISERLIKEETLAGPVFESLFNQPPDEKCESPALLTSVPEIAANGRGTDAISMQDSQSPRSSENGR